MAGGRTRPRRPGRATTMPSAWTAARPAQTLARPSRPGGLTAPPEGTDGPPRVADHSAFCWADGSWRGVPLPGSVLYECHIGTFSAEGTFDGAIGHLEHLVDIG